MADEFCLKMSDFHVTFRDLLHAVNLRHGTNSFTSLPKEGVLRIFSPWKNPTASAGFEPSNFDTKGQHATSRPPKPLLPCHKKLCILNYWQCHWMKCQMVTEPVCFTVPWNCFSWKSDRRPIIHWIIKTWGCNNSLKIFAKCPHWNITTLRFALTGFSKAFGRSIY